MFSSSAIRGQSRSFATCIEVQCPYECEQIINVEKDSDAALLCPIQFNKWFPESILAANLKARKQANGIAPHIPNDELNKNNRKPQPFLVRVLREYESIHHNFVKTMKHKLGLIGFESVTDDQVELLARRLCVAARTLPPRCIFAAVRTLMNAWCTSARFGVKRDCVFCGAEASDRIQHIRQCPAVRDTMSAALASPITLPTILSFENFFLVGCVSPSQSLLAIICLDVLYRAYTAAKYCTAHRGDEWLRDTIKARLRSIAQHSGSCRVLVSEHFR